MSDTSKPRYPHDCIHCMWLGHYKEFDLYYCDGCIHTVIARFGSEHKYNSGLCFVGHPNMPQLTEAACRAVEEALLDPLTKTGAADGGTVEAALLAAGCIPGTNR